MVLPVHQRVVSFLRLRTDENVVFDVFRFHADSGYIGQPFRPA
jgi:hypothetical protein